MSAAFTPLPSHMRVVPLPPPPAPAATVQIFSIVDEPTGPGHMNQWPASKKKNSCCTSARNV